MASHNPVTVSERDDLEKYIRFFILKAVQIIVQSRLGNRINSHSKLVSQGSDWFSIGVTDHAEIQDTTKRCVSQIKSLSAHTVNVEISLKTKEGETMVLEVWSSSMNTQHREAVKVSRCITQIRFSVYYRLSALLRSLSCVTRVVDGYRLSRNQCSDSYVICYKVYHGQPDTSRLGGPGAEPTQVDVGKVATPMGTVQLKAMCRSQLLFSPTNSCQDLDLKENYFTTESPTNHNKPVNPLSNIHLNSQEWQEEEGGDGRPPLGTSPQMDFVVVNHSSPSARNHKDSPKDKMFKLGNSSSDNTDSSSSAQPMKTPERLRRANGFAFAPRRASQISLDEDVPFSLLCEMSQHSGSTTEPFFSVSPQTVNDGKAFHTSLLDDAEFMEEFDKAPDEFEFVDVNTPFAVSDPDDDVSVFYKKLQITPDLGLLHSGPTISETIDQFNLDQFDKELEEFDDFCSQLSIATSGADHQGSPV